jgi:peptide/nickel transport system substrate-binding protein
MQGCNKRQYTDNPNTDYSTPVKGDWIIIHQMSDPSGLNPYTTTDAQAREIFIRIFESMLKLDFETLELVPALAKSRPEISEDHLTYMFELKENVFFSDGEQFTAEDVVFSFKAIKNPFVINAAALRSYYQDVNKVEAVDDFTIKVTMTKPYFLAEEFLGSLQMLPKHVFDPDGLTDKYTFEETNDLEAAEKNLAMKDFATWFDNSERSRNPEFIVGTGPYIFDEWRTNEILKLRRHDKYWNYGNDKSSTAYVKKIVFKTIFDRTIAVNALKNEDVDFIKYIPPNLFMEIDTNSTPYLATTSYFIPYYYYLGWNQRQPVFQNKITRQALACLVDKDMLIRTVNRGFAQATDSPIFKDRPEYDDNLPQFNYDPERAKKLLAQAGWEDSNNDGILDMQFEGKRLDFKFTWLINAGNEMREQIALLLTDEMQKVGIKAEVQKLEWSVYLENMRTHAFDATIGAWVNDPSPPDVYQLWHSSQAVKKGSNYCGFINARADTIIEANRLEFDPEVRKALMQEFQQIIVDDQPYTFLWLVEQPAGYHKRIQNVAFSSVRPGYNVTNWWVPTSLQHFD